MDKQAKIYVAGHRGMVGSAIMASLSARGYQNFVTRTSKELDLRKQEQVDDFFNKEHPDFVFLAAAKVGGIGANMKYPADFLYDNLAIQNHVIRASHQYGVSKIVFLGSSCIYPRDCPQPMKEEYLLTGKLEPTNEGYAIAKIAGLKLIEYFRKQYGLNGISVMPCNLYGTNDSFDPAHSHVLSALVKKFYDAAQENIDAVTVWGTGDARRELMHVTDCAEAIVHLFEHYDGSEFLNIGTGEDISIKELSRLVARLTGYCGRIEFDISKPDGMPRKCLDVTRLHDTGFRHKISLEEGIQQTIKEYISTIHK